MGRFLIHIDAQDFFWRRRACSPKHPQIRTRSSPESASRAAASRPDYPVASCASMFNDPENRFDRTWPLLPTGHERPLFHSRMIRPPGQGPDLFEGLRRDRQDALRVDQITLHSPLSTIHLVAPPSHTTRRLIRGETGVFQASIPETNACAWWLETGSKSSMGRFLIHIDAQDFFWRRRACSPKHPQIRTRSSPESASRAAASRPDYPVHPVHRCSMIRKTGSTGLGPCSRQAMNVPCFTLG